LKEALINAAMVGTGGFFGAIFRYGLSGLVHRKISFSVFPYGTLVVNLLGCLLIGVISGLVDTRQLFAPEFRKFALIGLLGGFTTYSTFSYETFAMIREAEYLRAAGNVGVHVVLGLVLLWAGYGLVTR
jgi:fluoride exporter